MLYYGSSLCYPFTTLYFFAIWRRYSYLYGVFFFALCEQLQNVALNSGVYKPPHCILECFLTALLSGPGGPQQAPRDLPHLTWDPCLCPSFPF